MQINDRIKDQDLRYAAVDIGSNSCRLLIAEFKDNQLKPLYSQLQTTRISEGLNHSGKISEPALERNLLCLGDFRQSIAAYGVSKYRAIATCAVREASNAKYFIEMAEQRSHLKVEVVSGEEEARLSYLGVEKGLPLNHPPLVVDLGGGSTEFICSEQDFITSVPLGAVRATELEMSSLEVSKRLADVAKMADNFKEYPLVMVGGTASSLVAIKLGLEVYEPSQVHGQILNRQDLVDIYQMLDRTPLALRRRIPGLQPERADIIGKGALIVLLIAEMMKKPELIVSETDLLQGMIWSGQHKIFI